MGKGRRQGASRRTEQVVRYGCYTRNETLRFNLPDPWKKETTFTELYDLKVYLLPKPLEMRLHHCFPTLCNCSSTLSFFASAQKMEGRRHFITQLVVNLLHLLRIRSELDIEESSDMIINSTFLTEVTHNKTQKIQSSQETSQPITTPHKTTQKEDRDLRIRC
jgi:hypothetical protein